MDRQAIRALALAVLLVGHSATAGLQIPGRRHPLVQAAFGTALAAVVRTPSGLRTPVLRDGIRWGAGAAAVAVAGVAVTTALPAVRAGMIARTLPRPGWKWLMVEIPLGTVWFEETAYRVALGDVAAAGFGPRCGRLFQALAFGVSHVADARATGDPVVGTVAVTGAAGWVFGWLAHRSGGVMAPMLAHLALNEAGAVAARWVQQRASVI
jgi:membrane protease YdiL (CAAX protease family)